MAQSGPISDTEDVFTVHFLYGIKCIYNKVVLNQACSSGLLSQPLGRLGQEEQKFKASLDSSSVTD